MAGAVRDFVTAEALVIERLRAIGYPIIDLEQLYRGRVFAAAGADLLAEMIPHERLVRGMMEVGALVDFPTFSTNTIGLQPGVRALIRAELEEVFPTECRIRLEADRIRHSFPIARSAIVGVEKRPGGAMVA